MTSLLFYHLFFPPSWLDTRRHTSAQFRSCVRHWALSSRHDCTGLKLEVNTAQVASYSSPTALAAVRHTGSAQSALSIQLLLSLALGADSGRTMLPRLLHRLLQATLQRCKLTWKLNLLEMNESRSMSRGVLSTNVSGVRMANQLVCKSARCTAMTCGFIEGFYWSIVLWRVDDTWTILQNWYFVNLSTMILKSVKYFDTISWPSDNVSINT